MQHPANRAFYIYTVFVAHLSDMPIAASYFNAYDFTTVIEINTVVITLTFVVVIHNFFTLSDIVGYPQYSIRSK
jgi:hypothetical protein